MMYDKPVAPDWYRCQCGKHGVKLWRRVTTKEGGLMTLSNAELFCASCLLAQPDLVLRDFCGYGGYPYIKGKNVTVRRSGAMWHQEANDEGEWVIPNFSPAYPASDKFNKTLSGHHDIPESRLWWEAMPTNGDETDAQEILDGSLCHRLAEGAAGALGKRWRGIAIVAVGEYDHLFLEHLPQNRKALEVLRGALDMMIRKIDDKLKEIEK